MQINNISPHNHKFLQIASHIAVFPKRLYFIGNLPDHRVPAIAVVGTRKPTTYGKEITQRLAGELAQKGVVIVSGLALGTDALAHYAALEAGGVTIAVLPCSLDRIYPATNRQLALRIVANGGILISEHPVGTRVFQANFIKRNRIVTAISDGLLVTEATAKSGTMHTARFALEQGKPVMAVPGNITSPASEGCNNLIRSGARVIVDVADVMDEIGLKNPVQSELPIGNTAEEHLILRLLANGVRDGVELHNQSGLSPEFFSQTLTMLEITGAIRPLGGNRWGLRN